MLKSRDLLHKTLFNVISKSGTTTETMATLMVIRDALGDTNWQQQVLATTGLTPDSVLFRMHEQSPFYGDTLLPVPDGVGGRFSAFSPVGLFFLAMTAGKGETPDSRIRSAVKGVGQADEDFSFPCEHQSNIAYQLARWIHLSEEIDETKHQAKTLLFSTIMPIIAASVNGLSNFTQNLFKNVVAVLTLYLRRDLRATTRFSTALSLARETKWSCLSIGKNSVPI